MLGSRTQLGGIHDLLNLNLALIRCREKFSLLSKDRTHSSAHAQIWQKRKACKETRLFLRHRDEDLAQVRLDRAELHPVHRPPPIQVGRRLPRGAHAKGRGRRGTRRWRRRKTSEQSTCTSTIYMSTWSHSYIQCYSSITTCSVYFFFVSFAVYGVL